jgi:hypothetical protein
MGINNGLSSPDLHFVVSPRSCQPPCYQNITSQFKKYYYVNNSILPTAVLSEHNLTLQELLLCKELVNGFGLLYYHNCSSIFEQCRSHHLHCGIQRISKTCSVWKIKVSLTPVRFLHFSFHSLLAAWEAPDVKPPWIRVLLEKLTVTQLVKKLF